MEKQFLLTLLIISGQYKKGTEKYPTVVLEAIVSGDLWFWHAFFGVPGSNNDINVLQWSPLLTQIISNTSPVEEWSCNGTVRRQTYFLADGIYPQWRIFAKPISKPNSAKMKHYTQQQEAVRKDVERAFGVLQARFRILAMPCRVWTTKNMGTIIRACIIMHNMIVADDGNNISVEVPGPCPVNAPDVVETSVEMVLERNEDNVGFIARRLAHIEDKDAHHLLRIDLIEHLWSWAGDQNG